MRTAPSPANKRMYSLNKVVSETFRLSALLAIFLWLFFLFIMVIKSKYAGGALSVIDVSETDWRVVYKLLERDIFHSGIFAISISSNYCTLRFIFQCNSLRAGILLNSYIVEKLKIKGVFNSEHLEDLANLAGKRYVELTPKERGLLGNAMIHGVFSHDWLLSNKDCEEIVEADTYREIAKILERSKKQIPKREFMTKLRYNILLMTNSS